MAVRPRAQWIEALLHTHLEELAYLAGQRRRALDATAHTLRSFADLQERMAAHLQGMLVAPADHLIPWLTPQLASAERDEAFAAAQVLLQLGRAEADQAVMVEFSRAKAGTLAGLAEALCLVPWATTQRCEAELSSALSHAKSEVAVAAALVLAHHQRLDPRHPRLQAWLAEPQAGVCAAAWRAVLHADTAHPAAAVTRPLAAGVTHVDAQVRHASWRAAAWLAPQATLAAVRQHAQGDDPVAWHWLAVLGDTQDVALIQRAVRLTPDAQARCALLSRFGHPMALPALMNWMTLDDVPLQAAAGEAFTRITGCDVRGQRRRLPVSDDADDFARDMAPEVWVPDPQRANRAWQAHGVRWDAGQRWCTGLQLDPTPSAEVVQQLDLAARWDLADRAAVRQQRCALPRPIC